MTEIKVQSSDLQKILDVLETAVFHHKFRDHSNASLHLAKETRYSPLTSELINAKDRLNRIMKEIADGIDGQTDV